MSANVRCDGKRSEMDGAVIFDACGWKGERFPTVNMAGTNWHEIPAGEMQALEDAARTTKRCPRCGGQVVLIVRDRIEANP